MNESEALTKLAHEAKLRRASQKRYAVNQKLKGNKRMVVYISNELHDKLEAMKKNWSLSSTTATITRLIEGESNATI